MKTASLGLPPVVSRAKWLGARKALLPKEEAATRAWDALNGERRRLPMVRIEKDCIFEGPNGRASLLDLFEGRILHADLKIGGSYVLRVDEFPEMDCRGPESIGGTPVTIHMYVEDVDTAFGKAVAAGPKVRMPLADMSWRDRYGVLTDPLGHAWSLATRKEEPTPQEIGTRAQAACSTATA